MIHELETFELPLEILLPEEHRPVELPPKADWRAIVQSSPELSRADAEVLATGRHLEFRHPILTDDLALRQRIEQEGGLAVGTLGVLLRNYRVGHYDFAELEVMVHRLMNASTLHMSRPFRGYVLSLLNGLQ